MHLFSGLLTLIRTSMVLAVVTVLAFGALAAPLSAAQVDHHATVSVDDGMSHDGQHGTLCPAGDAHDAGDGSCCVGTCSTILGVVSLLKMPTRLLSLNEPSFHPMVARPSSHEFIRPPSLAI
ncbi:MAG: hypothetical protein WBA25_16965 [Jannaschia sp.]